MKHSERFTNAVTKLYNAFHNGELNAYDCQKCAVGNMCDNNPDWSLLRVCLRQPLNPSAYKGDVKKLVDSTGYSPLEILTIENTFMNHFKNLADGIKAENQFLGLCAVIEYLCELEGIPNVMDYSKLFETEADKPKHILETVF